MIALYYSRKCTRFLITRIATPRHCNFEKHAVLIPRIATCFVIKKVSSDSCESKKTFQTCYHFSLSASHDTDLTECLSALLRDKGRNPLPPYSEFYLLHIILLLSAPLRSHVQLHFFYPSQLRIPSREFSVKSPAVYSFRLSVFMIFKSVAHPNLIVKPRHYLYISYTYPGNIMTVFLY